MPFAASRGESTSRESESTQPGHESPFRSSSLNPGPVTEASRASPRESQAHLSVGTLGNPPVGSQVLSGYFLPPQDQDGFTEISGPEPGHEGNRCEEMRKDQRGPSVKPRHSSPGRTGPSEFQLPAVTTQVKAEALIRTSWPL